MTYMVHEDVLRKQLGLDIDLLGQDLDILGLSLEQGKGYGYVEGLIWGKWLTLV